MSDRRVVSYSEVQNYVSQIRDLGYQFEQQYGQLRQECNILASEAFKGDTVAMIQEAMGIIESQKQQLKEIIDRFVQFLEKTVIESTQQTDASQASSLKTASENIKHFQ